MGGPASRCGAWGQVDTPGSRSGPGKQVGSREAGRGPRGQFRARGQVGGPGGRSGPGDRWGTRGAGRGPGERSGTRGADRGPGERSGNREAGLGPGGRWGTGGQAVPASLARRAPRPSAHTRPGVHLIGPRAGCVRAPGGDGQERGWDAVLPAPSTARRLAGASNRGLERNLDPGSPARDPSGRQPPLPPLSPPPSVPPTPPPLNLQTQGPRPPSAGRDCTPGLGGGGGSRERPGSGADSPSGPRRRPRPQPARSRPPSTCSRRCPAPRAQRSRAASASAAASSRLGAAPPRVCRARGRSQGKGAARAGSAARGGGVREQRAANRRRPRRGGPGAGLRRLHGCGTPPRPGVSDRWPPGPGARARAQPRAPARRCRAAAWRTSAPRRPGPLGSRGLRCRPPSWTRLCCRSPRFSC